MFRPWIVKFCMELMGFIPFLVHLRYSGRLTWAYTLTKLGLAVGDGAVGRVAGRAHAAQTGRGVELMSAQMFKHRSSFVWTVLLLVAAMAFAAPAMGAKPPAATLAFTGQPTDSSAGELISPAVVVVAKNSKGQINTRYSGVVTLTLQGPGTLYGTTAKPAVAGVATFTDLAVDPAGTYTLLATDGKTFAPKSSDQFSITGFALDCDGGPCSLSTGDATNPTAQDSVIGVVSVSTDDCADETCFLTVDEIEGDFCSPTGDGPCAGNAVKFITPANSTGIAEVQFACDKSLCPGTGVPNFPLYLQKGDLSVVPLVDCSKPVPDEGELPCIKSRSRTGVGDVVWTVWLTPDGDPAIGRG